MATFKPNDYRHVKYLWDDAHASSLDAVGFLAVITSALAKAGIGVNPVSAYFHDHLFVAEADAEEALAVLQGLAAGE